MNTCLGRIEPDMCGCLELVAVGSWQDLVGG